MSCQDSSRGSGVGADSSGCRSCRHTARFRKYLTCRPRLCYFVDYHVSFKH